jgi:hypothetical protein
MSQVAAKTFKARIKLKSGGVMELTIQAASEFQAKHMLEMLYGHGTVVFGPVPA